MICNCTRIMPPLVSIPIFRRLPPRFRKPLFTLLTIITYIPILAFSQTHLATLMTVTGASMYPLLNTDYNRSTRRDVVFVDLRDPAENLKRGMVVAFWLVWPTLPACLLNWKSCMGRLCEMDIAGKMNECSAGGAWQAVEITAQKELIINNFRSPNSPEKLAIKRIIALSDDIITTKPPYPFPNEKIPPGHIWVEGDHPESDRWSRDSNYYGPVSFHLPKFFSSSF